MFGQIVFSSSNQNVTFLQSEDKNIAVRMDQFWGLQFVPFFTGNATYIIHRNSKLGLEIGS